MALEKVTIGTRFKPNAEDWNAFVDAARLAKDRQFGGGAGAPDTSEIVLIKNDSGEVAPACGIMRIGTDTTNRAYLPGLKPDYSGRSSIGILPEAPVGIGSMAKATRSGEALVAVNLAAGQTIRVSGLADSGYDRVGPLAGSFYAQPDQLGIMRILRIFHPATGAAVSSWATAGVVRCRVLLTQQKGDNRIVVDENGAEIGTFTDFVFGAEYSVSVTDFGVPIVSLV